MVNMKVNSKISTILVVDDEETSLLLISTLLSLYDFKVLQANNGRDALEILENHPVDLILLDIMMPEMDGFEVCNHLRSGGPALTTPVIIVSAFIDKESRAKGQLLGADGFVNKPFMADELIHAIRSQSPPKETTIPAIHNHFSLLQ